MKCNTLIELSAAAPPVEFPNENRFWALSTLAKPLSQRRSTRWKHREDGRQRNGVSRMRKLGR